MGVLQCQACRLGWLAAHAALQSASHLDVIILHFPRAVNGFSFVSWTEFLFGLGGAVETVELQEWPGPLFAGLLMGSGTTAFPQARLRTSLFVYDIVPLERWAGRQVDLYPL